MAYTYEDPTSIDYILQRAQEELRRGETQHYRATEAQYTNHVKQLLGNLERYLETCGVQLPAEVISGAKTSAAAAAAAEAETTASAWKHADREAERSSSNALSGENAWPAQRASNGRSQCSISASNVPDRERVYRDGVHGPVEGTGDTGENEPGTSREGWGDLATPTEAQHPGSRNDPSGTDHIDAVMSRTKPEPAGLEGIMTSLGSNDANSPVSPLPSGNGPMECPSNFGSKSEPQSDRNKSLTSALYTAQQRPRSQAACSLSSHSPVRGGAGNLTTAPIHSGSVMDSVSFSMVSESEPLVDVMRSVNGDGITAFARNARTHGTPTPSPPPSAKPQQQHYQQLQQVAQHISANASPPPPSSRDGDTTAGAQHTPHVEFMDTSSSPLTASEAVTPNILSTSGPGGLAMHMASGTDPWGDFGQFVQSITESRLNSNFNSLQSVVAAGAFPLPPGYLSNNNVHVKSAVPPPPPPPPRGPEGRVATGLLADQASTGAPFAVAAPSTMNVTNSGFHLPRVLATASASSKEPMPSNWQSRGLSQPITAHSAPSVVTHTGSATTASANTSYQQHQQQQQHLSGTVVTSISSRSPSIAGLAATACGAGSNAGRALTATTAHHHGGAAAIHLEHIPSPPHHPRPSTADVGGPPAAAPMQRASSMPPAGYLPYGSGGNPMYPHILCVSTPPTLLQQETQMNSPVQSTTPFITPALSVARRGGTTSESAATTTIIVSSPPRTVEDKTAPIDGTAAMRSQEKEELMRRLRGILDRSSSPSVVHSLLDVDGSAVAMPCNREERWGVRVTPASASFAAAANAGSGGAVEHKKLASVKHGSGSDNVPENCWAESSVCPFFVTGSVSAASPVPAKNLTRARRPSTPDHTTANRRGTPDASSHVRSSVVLSKQISGTRAFANDDSWEQLRHTTGSPISAQLYSVSGKETTGPATGLPNLSRRMVFSYDLSVDIPANVPRRPLPTKQASSTSTRLGESPTAAGLQGGDVSSYNTAANGAATSTYAVHTVAPSTTSSAVRSPPMLYEQSSASLSNYQVDLRVLAREVNPPNAQRTASHDRESGSASWAGSEAVHEEKQQLMQRLRHVLSRSDE